MEHITWNMEHGTCPTERPEPSGRVGSIGEGKKLKNLSPVTCSMLHAPCSAGFALMFAVLAISVLLSIALAIWNIALREVALSTYGRESQIAFYAADAGVECALYWDFIGGGFATDANYSNFDNNEIKCAGPNSVPVTVTAIQNPRPPFISAVLSKFSLSSSGVCVDVEVYKFNDDTDVFSDASGVYARGRNTCDESNPRRVERAIQIDY